MYVGRALRFRRQRGLRRWWRLGAVWRARRAVVHLRTRVLWALRVGPAMSKLSQAAASSRAQLALMLEAVEHSMWNAMLMALASWHRQAAHGQQREAASMPLVRRGRLSMALRELMSAGRRRVASAAVLAQGTQERGYRRRMLLLN